MKECVFCSIIVGELPATVVYRDAHTIAFLDTHPLFLGHILVATIVHRETLLDVGDELTPLYTTVQRAAHAVQIALSADGSFVAQNNVVSQSVPHLHVHVVPRRKKDGLRGFFWPRQRYASDEEREDYGSRLRAAMRV